MKPLFSGTFPDPMRTGNVSENQPRGAVIRIHPDMLIFVSPRYADDKNLERAVLEYATAVREGPTQWRSHIIYLNQDSNHKEVIDQIIENEYKQTHILKAVLVIGEDTEVYLGHTLDGQEAPLPDIWADTNGEITSEGYFTPVWGGPLEKYDPRVAKWARFTPEVGVSFLFQSEDVALETKKRQLAMTLRKFASNQTTTYNGSVQFVGDPTLEYRDFKDQTEAALLLGGTFVYVPNPKMKDLALNDPHLFYFAFGHGNPYSISVDNTCELICAFFDHHLARLNSPIFVGSGCFVGGWNTSVEQSNNDILDVPTGWFLGSSLLTNPTLRVSILGLYNETALPQIIERLANGKTVAEALLVKRLVGDIVIYGDPTLKLRLTPDESFRNTLP